MLNELEQAQAKSYGWIVAEVYDLQTKKLSVKVLPTPNNSVRNAEDLMRVVIERARCNDGFARKVLKLVMDGLKTN